MSLNHFANKNNSLGSFNSQHMADLSNLPSITGEDALSGLDSRGRGQQGRANAPGQGQVCQGQAGRSPRGESGTDWAAQLDSKAVQDHDGDHPTSGSGRHDPKEEGDQYTQGLFLKQLQQQRQQKHDSSHPQDPRSRSSTPPSNPRQEPDQAKPRPPSGDPKLKDPRAAPASSPYHDAHARAAPSASHQQPSEQGGADRHSPVEYKQPSNFLAELQQAIEPAVKASDNRSPFHPYCCHLLCSLLAPPILMRRMGIKTSQLSVLPSAGTTDQLCRLADACNMTIVLSGDMSLCPSVLDGLTLSCQSCPCLSATYCCIRCSRMWLEISVELLLAMPVCSLPVAGCSSSLMSVTLLLTVCRGMRSYDGGEHICVLQGAKAEEEKGSCQQQSSKAEDEQ